MTSPVLTALVNARMAEISSVDHAIETVCVELLGLPPKYADAGPTIFNAWCTKKGLPPLPASPASVALFAFEQAGQRSIDDLMAEIAKISASHCSKWLADPTTSWAPTTALTLIRKIDAPHGWREDAKTQFAALPYALQAEVSRRDSDRDKALRKIQEEVASFRKRLQAAVGKGTEELTQ